MSSQKRSLPFRPSKRPSKRTARNRRSNDDDAEEVFNSPYQDPNIPEIVRSQLPSGGRASRTQLAWHLPPMHTLDDIYKSITGVALKLGFDRALSHLGARPLRVVTVCSGTESPLLALEMVQKNLREHFNMSFEFHHLFSAEIVPFKQAYIERNFHPQFIFRDVEELKDRVAQTAYGSLEKIPKNPDILIAGFSCVDFSTLNNKRKTLDQKGESGGTFWGIVRYAATYRPRLVILENVRTAPWEKIKQHWDEINYVATYVDVDTKAFYLPQTRERGYMFCVDREAMRKQNLSDSDMMGWAQLVGDFKRPASSPAGMFLVGADDKRLEQIEKDMSTRMKPSRTAVNWAKYQVRHQGYRLSNALGHKRPVSRSQDDGTCEMPDFMWQAWVKSLPERIWDTLDMNFLRKLVEGYDMHHKERFIELSQGVDREVEIRAFGILGCITPCGIPFLTTRGGPLCGLESLALQGLPLERLLLTRESQRELQDLAGNAMSSTVVGAAVLAALIVGYKVLKRGDQSAAHNVRSTKHKGITPQSGHKMTPKDIHLCDIAHLDVLELQDQAASSARYCVCERQTAIRASILKCTLCHHTACSECGGNPAHAYERWSSLKRTKPLDFVSRLRRSLPARLVVSGLSRDCYTGLIGAVADNLPSEVADHFLEAIALAIGDELRLLDIKRSEVWTVHYEGAHSALHLVIGETGMSWLFFAKPSDSAPTLCMIREILSKPIARMTSGSSSFLDGNWEVCAPLSSKRTLYFSGVGPQVPSYEARCGLQLDKFVDSKSWTHIQVEGSDEAVVGLGVDVRGIYDSLPDCGTANACLHKRSARNDGPPVYLFLDPTKLGAPKNDSFVFAWEHRRVPGYTTRLTIAEVSHTWRSAKATEDPRPVDVYFRQWMQVPAMALNPYAPAAPIPCYQLDTENSISIGRSGCQDANITLLQFKPPTTALETGWKDGSWQVINPTDSPSSLKDFGWLLQKAADVWEFQDWNEVAETQSLTKSAESECACVPLKPRILWGRDRRGWIKAYEDPHDAALYARQVKAKPPAFLIFRRVDDQGVGDLRVTLNVQTLLHQAYDRLVRDNIAKGVSFQWRLIPNSYDTRNISFPKFELGSNRNDSPYGQPPGFRLELRPEQLRSLAWMIQQEDDNILPFMEEEIEEALLPSLMWRAEGRVTVPKTVRGGILADDVGYGKTAITLGLIDSLQGRDQQSLSEVPEGFIPTKATLIVVPHVMLQQWQAEVAKFLGGKLKVLVFISAASFKRTSIRDVLQSDIILVSWALFNNQGYYEKLQRFTGTPRVPRAAGRNFDAWFKEAQAALRDQVKILTSHGPTALLDSIRLRRQDVQNAQSSSTYFPSMRLRGKKYVESNRGWESVTKDGLPYADVSSDEASEPEDEPDAETLRVKTDQCLKLRPGKPSGAMEMVDSDGDETQYEDSSREADQVRPAPVRKVGGQKRKTGDSAAGKKAEKAWDDRKEFNIGKGKDQSWETVRTPLLHAFSFNRLIIDEFTYANPERLNPLLALQARSKWVLSGTPPLNDFADVNTIAPFLGVHLGVDEDDVQSQNKRLKILCKQQSAAEKFQSFRAPHSEAWHSHRHEIAQRFLDRFARKNVAEIDEIPSSEHIVLIHASPAERAIYLELYKQLMTYNRQLRRGRRGRFSSDQVERLDEIIGSSTTAEEALLKRCSSLALQGRWDDNGRPENTTCASLIATREKQLDDLRSDLMMKLRLAAFVYCDCDLRHEAFHKFIESIARDDFGDTTVTQEVYLLVKTALLTSSADDWKFFFAAPEEQLSDTEDTSDEEAQTTSEAESENEIESVKDEELASPAAKRTRVAIGQNQASQSHKSSGSNGPGKDESKNSELPKRPSDPDDFEPILKDITTTIRDLIVEWILRGRALRFLKTIHLVQTGTEVGQCDSCCCELETVENMNVLGSCGHALCTECSAQTMLMEECAVQGCRGSGKRFNIIKASTLGRNEVDRGSDFGGSKMDGMIEIVRSIPSNERALLFIQFPELMEVASKALDLAGIKHAAISATDRRSAQKIEKLQRTSFGDDKVLILNLGSEMAAGLNLQRANHVIFLSPMLTQTQYDWESAMTQAIGRCRRYGQTRHVHIYHLLVKGTMDVNIFQSRREKMLVERDGEAVLVDPNEASKIEAISFPRGRTTAAHSATPGHLQKVDWEGKETSEFWQEPAALISL
ncbi:putative SNF2 family helicase [Aspergillus ibericus CBS 121593]|uniref:C-5 cytosine-specific DNA methylase n=1 Tax=Aspergillus ibericus CBS 121593 TaxID=1448316 RepID=A0A395GLS0_9EURO|nr:C-5 cytosine-specific DNA methylase [Aspergillus ibericus CBS 121593]RAK96334.1 C-5 cytosine-specific DNA methylase [Aspergillus ibericus CBS 121593]